MPTITLREGIEIYYEEFGSGPPIVFTSCGLMTHKQWEHQVSLLAKDFRTITYDWCGTGRSSKPNVPYTTDLAVEVLCGLMDGLKIKSATLVGHGVGNHVNITAALKRTDLIERLVIASGAPWYHGDHDGVSGGFSDEFMKFWQERMSQRSITSAQAYSDLGEYLYYKEPHPALAHYCFEQAFEWPLHVFKSYCSDMNALDLREPAATLSCPTLVLHGRHDKKQRYGGGVYFSRHIRGARFVTFEESAHMIMLEEMGRFSDEVSKFAREQAQSGAGEKMRNVA
jgi:pimeloyl-ACP methyl ester carboxylesterase